MNPSNWFGDSTSTAADPSVQSEATNPLVPEKTGSGLFERPEKPDRSVPIAVASRCQVRGQDA